MLRTILTVVAMFAMGIAVAGAPMTEPQDKSKSNKIIYDPIDYAAVQRALARASQPTLLQRVVESMRSPVVVRDNFQLDARAGIAYTRETNLALTLASSAIYHSDKTSSTSSAQVAAMASISGFYRVQANGEHYISDRSRIRWGADVASLPTRFWGLGYEAAINNTRSEYTSFSSNASAQYLYHIGHKVHIGAGIDLRYGKGHRFEPLAEEYLLQGAQSRLSAYTTGFSLNALYDSRNDSHTTTKGLYLAFTPELRPKALGNYHTTLWHFTAQADFYQPLWKGATAAIDLYADLWSSAAPWFYWPALGGQSRMRGYYYGRYTDSKMLTAQVELRQHIYGPLGAVVWGGAGNIFSTLSTFDWGHTLPNAGVGLRLNLNNRTALRIDYGFGRRTGGLIINVNEAF